MPTASRALYTERKLCSNSYIFNYFVLDTSKKFPNTDLCTSYNKIPLLLACGYFNPLNEISFQSYLKYHIKYHIPFCLCNELVNTVIVEESKSSHYASQLPFLLQLHTSYWTLFARMYPHVMLLFTLQSINHRVQPHSHCTSCLLCSYRLILPIDWQFLNGCEQKLVPK